MRILISDDDKVSNWLLESTLSKWGHQVITTANGLEAWRVLQGEDPPMLAILDWIMPGMDGPEVCRNVRNQNSNLPPYLILLTAKKSKEDLIEGLEAGADDFLTKPFHSHELKVRLKVGERIVELQRSLALRVGELENAVEERRRAEEALRNLTLTDELTNLYNRRGFFTFADHMLKTARRAGQSTLLVFADMDGLKQINDTFGHNEGSTAIKNAGAILLRTCREIDIVARIGGDEFAILATNMPSGEINGLIHRVYSSFEKYNEQNELLYTLAVSLGSVPIPPDSTLTIQELFDQADISMYEAKRARQQQRQPDR